MAKRRSHAERISGNGGYAGPLLRDQGNRAQQQLLSRQSEESESRPFRTPPRLKSSKSHASGRCYRPPTSADAMASEQAVGAIDSEQDQIRFSNRICHLAGLRRGQQPGGRPATIVPQAGKYADEDLQVLRWGMRERPFPSRLQQRLACAPLPPPRRNRRRRLQRETSWTALDI